MVRSGGGRHGGGGGGGVVTRNAGPPLKKVGGGGPVTERLTLLEKRYSRVVVHQTYFKILDEWMQCMFGAQLFPKPSEVQINEDEIDEDNPFYEIHVLSQRIFALEDKLASLGYPIASAPSRPVFKKPAPPPPPSKPAVKRTYGAPTATMRKRPGYAARPVAPSTSTEGSSKAAGGLSPTKKPATVTAAATVKSEPVVSLFKLNTEDKVKAEPQPGPSTPPVIVEEGKKDEDKVEDKKAEDEGAIETEEGTKLPTDEVDKPPVLTQEGFAPDESVQDDTAKTPTAAEKSPEVEDRSPPDVTGSGAEEPTKSEPSDDVEDMDVDDDDDDEEEEMDEYLEEEEEDIEQKPIVPTPEEIAAASESQTPGRSRAVRGTKRAAAAAIPVINDPEDEPVVTYTTRGRRHTVPRRYAEYTGHDNVASILKSQQRSAAEKQATKSKKVAQQQQQEKPLKPLKPKLAPVPKVVTPKKPPADGTRPECVYQLIGQVQAKEVDADGNIVLWDTYPNVKVSQQQLISVIFRSNGMSTRLTRKMTTLVFEDQILANASPFGTKYYQERLPSERLEAMVDFIVESGFDPEYSKKKIYMIVGQVCNEARAGRVRKLLPVTGPNGEELPGPSF